jgi:hypothetical protein
MLLVGKLQLSEELDGFAQVSFLFWSLDALEKRAVGEVVCENSLALHLA